MEIRYLGIAVMALSLLMAYTVYSISSGLISSIDMSDSCSSVSTCPHVTALNQSYVGYIGSAIMFIIGLMIFLKAGPSSRRRPEPGNLQPDEKKVYGLIQDAGGMIFQSELVEKSGFPKARVTRLLDRLESKDVLERRRRGMTNAVMLK